MTGPETCAKSGKQMLGQGQAKAAARRWHQRFHARMDAYRCPSCGAWHVGHRRVRKPRRVRR